MADQDGLAPPLNENSFILGKDWEKTKRDTQILVILFAAQGFLHRGFIGLYESP